MQLVTELRCDHQTVCWSPSPPRRPVTVLRCRWKHGTKGPSEAHQRSLSKAKPCQLASSLFPSAEALILLVDVKLEMSVERFLDVANNGSPGRTFPD